MQGQNMVAHIIRKRGSFQSRDKIAQVLAQSGSLDYYQAQNFIRQVESKYARQIAMRQLPMTLILGIPGLIVGLILGLNLIASLYYGRFRVTTIYVGLSGLGLVGGSIWGIWTVLSKIVRGK